MKNLYTEITIDENFITTVGNNIIDTFYNGNFTQGVKDLIEIGASPRDFGNYIQEETEEMGYESMYDFAGGHFNYDFWISLGESYYTIARES